MPLPNKIEAQKLLEEHVKDEYQLYHAVMVATAMEGYAKLSGQDPDLWYITGLLHDIDFEEHPDTHPAQSLAWFKEWGYPEDLIHAVTAHAYNYNGFTTLPNSPLAAGLMACDEISGLFYAYSKLNPIPYKDIKVSSIKKRFNEKSFAAKIDRATIDRGIQALATFFPTLGLTLDEQIKNLITFFSVLV
ncbi:MAG: HD domain-containing protein [Patescibacteria group bacterium]|nr:HD domain-containing protein [Patescibacteria group bacterium]